MLLVRHEVPVFMLVFDKRLTSAGKGDQMRVQVTVTDQKRVDRDQYGSGYHDSEREKKRKCNGFAQQQYREENADERRDGIIGACFRGAEFFLRAHVQKYT